MESLAEKLPLPSKRIKRRRKRAVAPVPASSAIESNSDFAESAEIAVASLRIAAESLEIDKAALKTAADSLGVSRKSLEVDKAALKIATESLEVDKAALKVNIKSLFYNRCVTAMTVLVLLLPYIDSYVKQSQIDKSINQPVEMVPKIDSRTSGWNRNPVTLPPTLVNVDPSVQSLPMIIEEAGNAARHRVIEFFTASLRNRNTRLAYWQACSAFLEYCYAMGVSLEAIGPVHVASYIEQLSQLRAAPTVKQHLAAIRRLFDFLVVGQILPANPAASVRGPKHVVTEGKTPILDAEEARALFAQFDPTLLPDLRDRAMLGVMAYSFCRVSALAKLRVRDYYRQGTRAWFLFDEKGGRQNKVPVHHQVAEYLDQYLVAAGIGEQREALLFRSLGRGRRGKNAALTERGLDRREILAMVRRRAAIAGLPVEICCHSFRGTGITNYLQNSGTLEVAARLAGHTSIRTTQLYDRRSKEVEQGEIERVRF